MSDLHEEQLKTFKGILKRRRGIKKLWVRFYKINRRCIFCGENDPDKLTFHHIIKESKISEINNIVGGGATWKGLLKEIAKCDVLCRDCHDEVDAMIPKRKRLMLVNAGKEEFVSPVALLAEIRYLGKRKVKLGRRNTLKRR